MFNCSKSIIIALVAFMFLTGCINGKETHNRLDSIDKEFTVVEEEILKGLNQLLPEVKNVQEDTKILIRYLNDESSIANIKKLRELVNDYQREMENLKTRDIKVKLKYEQLLQNYNDLVYLHSLNDIFDDLNEEEKRKAFSMILGYSI